MYVSANGDLHFIKRETLKKGDKPQERKLVHYFQCADSKTWHRREIATVTKPSRTSIASDTNHNVYAVVIDYGDNHTLKILKANADNDFNDWSVIQEHGAYNSPQHYSQGRKEIPFDTGRLCQENILTLLVQDEPETPGAPSPLHAVDFVVNHLQTEEHYRAAGDTSTNEARITIDANLHSSLDTRAIPQDSPKSINRRER